MKTLLAAIAVLSFTSCGMAPAADVPAVENADGTTTLTLNKAQTEYCDKHGGCIVVPIEMVREAIQRARLSCGKET